VKHRFASHVVQTMLEFAPDTINRKVRPFPLLPCSVTENQTVPWYISSCARVVKRFRRASAALPARVRPLRGASPPNHSSVYLTVLPSQELIPSTASLLADPLASHVLRALLVLLRPVLAPAASHSAAKANLRSRKSAAWKARHGPLRSVFADDAGKPAAGARALPKVPKTFGALARRVVEAVRGALGANEIRALAADKLASPLLQAPPLLVRLRRVHERLTRVTQLLLAFEAKLRMADEVGSLMDHVLDGLVFFARMCPSGMRRPGTLNHSAQTRTRMLRPLRRSSRTTSPLSCVTRPRRTRSKACSRTHPRLCARTCSACIWARSSSSSRNTPSRTLPCSGRSRAPLRRSSARRWMCSLARRAGLSVRAL
jgi:hypothetical protein